MSEEHEIMHINITKPVTGKYKVGNTESNSRRGIDAI